MTNVQQDGRVALITGASRGIGAAVARLLASRGMRVVVNYPSVAAQALSSVAQELGVATVPDTPDIYHTQLAEESAASPRGAR